MEPVVAEYKLVVDREGEMSDRAAQNTDRELWRKIPGNYYSPSIHVTEQGAIGINVGGTVYVMPVENWHALLGRLAAVEKELAIINKLNTEKIIRLSEQADELEKAEAKLAQAEQVVDLGMKAMEYIVYCRRPLDDLNITPENIYDKLDDCMNELERVFVKQAKALAATDAGQERT